MSTTTRCTAYGEAFKAATSRRSKTYASAQRFHDQMECMFQLNTAFSLGLVYEHGGQYAAGLDRTFMNYDFLNRVLIVEKRAPNIVTVATTPFSQLDREVLEAMRGKLVELGGNPPPLPEGKPVFISPDKKA